MDEKVRIKVHTQPGKERVATVITSSGRVIRVIGTTTRSHRSKLGDVVDIMMGWVTWERRGRPDWR
jgi:hypothetical protein